MTNKHTPGPWDFKGLTIVHGGNKTIANVTPAGEFVSEAEHMANATLMTAAPEMKDALIGIHELWGGDDGYLKEVEACEELGNESPVLKAWKQLLSAIKKSGGM